MRIPAIHSTERVTTTEGTHTLYHTSQGPVLSVGPALYRPSLSDVQHSEYIVHILPSGSNLDRMAIDTYRRGQWADCQDSGNPLPGMTTRR